LKNVSGITISLANRYLSSTVWMLIKASSLIIESCSARLSILLLTQLAEPLGNGASVHAVVRILLLLSYKDVCIDWGLRPS